jgi:hypothetical protein
VAVLGGSLKSVQGVLDTWERSQQQLDEALELAAMLGRVQMLRLLLKKGADPTARGAAAVAWAEQRQGDVAATLQEALTVLPHRSHSSSSSSPAGNLAVAAWCRGLHKELSGLRNPNTPQPRLMSLKQFLSDDTSPGQRTVANLLAQLQQQWPELFASQESSPRMTRMILNTVFAAGAASNQGRGSPSAGMPGQDQKPAGSTGRSIP